MTDLNPSRTTPNAAPGQAGRDGIDPNVVGPREVPGVFRERHVDLTPVPDPAAAQQALNTARDAAASSPNAPEQRPPDRAPLTPKIVAASPHIIVPRRSR